VIRVRRRLPVPLLVALVPVLLAGGIWLGGHPQNLPGFARDALVGDSEAQTYQEAIDTIADNYYREVDEDELLDEGLGAGVASLDDRFSAYFDPEEYREFAQATDGALEGVGMSVEQDAGRKGLRVLTVFDRSPAKRGGLREGDLITEVDGRSLAGTNSQKATALIKGKAGTRVKLTVITGKQEPRVLDLERARVDVPVVEARMERSGTSKVAHVALSGFTSGAHGELRVALDKLLERGADGVVLDLRHNGGGLLSEAVQVSSIFIRDGTIVSTKGRKRARRVFEATGSSIDAKVPVVVLVDQASASASEIVAGAIQDRGRGELVGARTFGKGVFQEIRRLSNGGALDITVGEYFTPKGRNLGGGGVQPGSGLTPDVRAEDDPKTTRTDEALDAAVKTVLAEGT